ncbi:exodeoxyribonuclease VII large subunit [Acidipila sp. EB88]|uniref:exodeoxyribonuclease VII large subunit n=1 Tax=Acidipila sp. EB88 TaxID=2305226 RepID=UPI001F2FDDBC|nr:exodeoxyribonuclease VII large subunit [Acidipila sp. EB88]
MSKPVAEPPAVAEPTARIEQAERRPARQVWRVADLVGEVRNHIEQAYADLWVRGEISNLRAAPSGHMYFTLKDGDAQLPAVLFRRQAQLLRFRPEDGLEVLLRGRVSVYEQRGQMQLIAEYLEPVGAGSLQIAFEQLKRKLEAEGLFAMDRKQPLPAYPRCVGIVTSPTGAVIRDFLNVAGRRHAALDVLLFPAAVQGDQSAAEVAAGIAYFNRVRDKAHPHCVDVIVIARGGGSLEDLAPFNSELVARAIATSTVPVVSAVGHETDFTIADFVADLRAPTPSAAAELITAAQHRVEEHVAALEQRLARAMRYGVALSHQRLARASIEAGFARLRDSLGRREQRLDEQRFRLERAQSSRLRSVAENLQRTTARLLHQDATQRLHLMRERLAALQQRLARAGEQRVLVATQRQMRAADALARYDAMQPLRTLKEAQTSLGDRLVRAVGMRVTAATQQRETASRALGALSPLAVLGRGYALVFAADGSLITTPSAPQNGDAIQVRMAAGVLDATVTK